MRPGITDVAPTWNQGETLHTWATVDQGPPSGRRLTVERLELYVVHTTGGAGEPPRSQGYYTQEEAEAAAGQYMAEPDGRGITQDWQETN